MADPPLATVALTEKPRREVKLESLGEEMRGERVLLKPRASLLREFRRVWEAGNGFSSKDLGKGVRDLREGKVGVVAAVVMARDAIWMAENGICCCGAQRSSESRSSCVGS
ncbi:hypothetical protein C1H46_037059 [Malus baccata]|uniref:Uncharacterized protein n=1 Tax=Malus baccata TaxID=106549 RepID=A0A540KT66_MALBA|nr:hypothetical protein C1H46_037059 [Malus baccata]